MPISHAPIRRHGYGALFESLRSNYTLRIAVTGCGGVCTLDTRAVYAAQLVGLVVLGDISLGGRQRLSSLEDMILAFSIFDGVFSGSQPDVGFAGIPTISMSSRQ